MVAVIHASGSFRKVLNYNEQKVIEGVATCIEAGFYLKEPADLTFNQKLSRLRDLASLNERTKVNCVHISLNFDPSENHSEDILKEITASYLDKLGFGGQPYLLYQHFDSGHPHVHVLTTNIRPNGERIDLHHLGEIRSEPARKEVETEFGLVKAEDSNERGVYELKPINAKVQYGKSPSKRAIINVLNHVLDNYKYSSLQELNAVLGLYNVAAERGSEKSRVFLNNGLVYRIKNEDGTMQGVPIKSSDFYSKPTLKYLEQKFKKGEIEKPQFKSHLKNAIEVAIRKPGIDSLIKLCDALQSQGIHVVLRQNKDGVIYGITYVDHRNKCVFNGSDLDKKYSAKGITDYFVTKEKPQQATSVSSEQKHSEFQNSQDQTFTPIGSGITGEAANDNIIGDTLSSLLESEHSFENLPYELSGKKKRRRKKKRSTDH